MTTLLRGTPDTGEHLASLAGLRLTELIKRLDADSTLRAAVQHLIANPNRVSRFQSAL